MWRKKSKEDNNMIIAVDIETRGLDATKYIIGCLKKEKCDKTEYYETKEQLWQRILELGQKETERKKTLSVYSHNASYDFYGYANLEDKNLHWFSQRPFIVTYEKDRQEQIKFLDTWAIFKMSLQQLGENIGLPKLETPKDLLKDEVKVTPRLIRRIKPYVKRDTEICLRAIIKLREHLKQDGIRVRRLYTINQIAINYLINQLRKYDNKNTFFWNKRTGETRRTLRPEEIHHAYRGGRVDCWKLGEIPRVTHIDCNSLYPYSISNMRFPDLTTERKAWRPNRGILEKIGVARVMIKNRRNNLGLLPIRTLTGNYFPKKGKTLIGTYTHQEIKTAIMEGYELKDIEWSVHYEEQENIIAPIMDEIYRKRTETKDEFLRYFYKMMMNGSIGKLAQTRTNQEIIIDSVEKAQEYLRNGSRIIKGMGYNYMYQKDQIGKTKRYYTPIIPTLTNAYARIYMYGMYKRIKPRDLVYTGNDSIIYTGDYLKQYKISPEMGDFKILDKDQKAQIYGRNTYSIGNNIKISGIRRGNVEIEDFRKGKVKNQIMNTIKTTQDMKQVGTFYEEKRDLNTQLDQYRKVIETYEEQELFIDANIEDINYFLPHL